MKKSMLGVPVLSGPEMMQARKAAKVSRKELARRLLLEMCLSRDVIRVEEDDAIDFVRAVEAGEFDHPDDTFDRELYTFNMFGVCAIPRSWRPGDKL